MKKKGGISPVDFFCIGFGAIVGVGWAVSINNWMKSSGGPLPAAAGYILALVLMVPVALCYCELCSMLPVSGGGMSYAFRAFGDRFAFISGWAAFGAFVTIIPWESIYVVDVLSIVFPVLKTGSPLYTLAGSDIYIGHIIVGTAISILLFVINRRGIQTSAVLQRVLCFVLVGSGILAMIFASVKIDPANYQPIYENQGSGFHASFFGGALSILASAPFFLAGFETIPQGIEEAGGQAKSIGKTVVLTVIIACVFYALLLVTLGGAVPWKEFLSYPAPAVANLFKSIYPGSLGNLLYTLILVGAVCGLLTTWNGFFMASSQLLMAMARVSIVPFSLSKQHPKYKTPTKALVVALVASLIGPFLGMGLIDPLTSFSAAGYVLSWMLSAFCLIKLRKKEPDLNRPYRIPGGEKTAWFAGLCMAVLLLLLLIPGQPIFMGSKAVLLFLSWMVIGLGLYIIDYKQRKRYSQMKRATILFASMAGKDVNVPEFADKFENDYRIISFVVPKDALYKGQTLMELGWGQRQNIFVIKIERGTEILLLPGGKVEVCAGDRVFAVGLERAIRRFRDYQDIGPKYTVNTLKNFMGLGDMEKQSPLICVEIKVEGGEPYCEKAIRDCKIQETAHCIVVGIQRWDGGTMEMPEAGTIIHKGDIMWVMGSEHDIETMKAYSASQKREDATEA